MNIEKKSSFPAEDGHIESILIGVDTVKVSFQTWDARKLVLIFQNVETVWSSHSVYGDISGFETACGDTFKKYIFYSAWYDKENEDKQVLLIEAENMKIVQVGDGAKLNSAVFDVGYEYIGNQECLYEV